MELGKRFGRYTVTGEKILSRKSKIEVTCDCGTVKLIRIDVLNSGTANSCGCLRNELTVLRETKHGMYGSRIYGIWANMKYRCSNGKDEICRDYYDKGIRVCDEWIKFEPFFKWSLENGYAEHLTIDRIYGKGNYTPENCRWATYTEQNLNRTSTKINLKGTLKQTGSV